jgi:zinc transporter, ZIP family
MPVNAGTVALLALVTALATGLGALPLAFGRSARSSWIGPASAVAAGAMLAATLALVGEGVNESTWRTALGLALGVAFVGLTRGLLRGQEELHFLGLTGADALSALVIVGVMTIHSFSEGVGIGVAFGPGDALGFFITAALALHNIPEGLAISLILVPRGVSVRRAAAWSVFSSLPQPLVAPLAFVFVESFGQVLPVGLGFAAGAMAWMVFAEILPAARAAARPAVVAAALGTSFTAMTALQLLFLLY